MSAATEDVVRRFYEDVWNGRRYELGDDLFHPEFGYAGGEAAGPEAKLGALRSYHAAMPDLVVTVEDIVVSGDTAAVRFVVEGTDTGGIRGRAASGKAVRAWGVDFFELRDGRIVSNWVGVDWLGLLVQTGAVPDPWT